jgi:hypothetical protein
LAAAGRWAVAAPITLPVYIEDSHAGSFYWLARQLDLDRGRHGAAAVLLPGQQQQPAHDRPGFIAAQRLQH